MKNIAIWLIIGYQKFCSPLLRLLLGTPNLCRYPVSCSEYAKQSIKKNGIIKGGVLSIIRILSCQPWVDLKRKTYSL